MMRFSLALIIVCVGITVNIMLAEDVKVANSGGIVRGKIVDTTKSENPIEGVEVKIVAPDGTEFTAITDLKGEFVRIGIPAGRYLINIHKEGYGDRLGKPVTVVNGGHHLVSLKMTPKKENIFTFLEKYKEKKQRTIENMSQDSHGHWYNLTIMDTKIGYMHTSAEKTEYQGEEMTRYKSNSVMNLKALGTDLALEITSIEYISVDLTLRHFLYTSNMSDLKQVEGRIVDGIAYIKTTLNGETTESEVPVPPDTISASTGVESLLSQEGLKIGDKRTFHVFYYDLMKPVKTEIEVTGKETLTYQSEEKQVYVLDGTLDMMGGVTLKQWISPNGVSYRTEILLMGVPQVNTKTDRETAIGGIEEVDLVLKTRILPTGKRPTPKAENFVADVKLNTGNIAEAIMSNPRQKLELRTPQSGRLVVHTPTVTVENCPELPIQNAESEFLAASAYIQVNHPDIQVKAKEILDGEVNSWRAAEKLCRWVHTSITDKTISAGFGTSLKTLSSLTGDCTEHTVLFIALARAAGIPSRICSGIVFSKDAFYYHFWPEVYVGEWVQMDPTLGQVIADANHIQLWGNNLESDTMIEFAEGVYRTINQLEIVITE